MRRSQTNEISRGFALKIVRCFVLLGVLAAVTVLGAGPASATTTAECQGQLADLRSATISAAPSFTNTRSVDGLVDKLDAAATKLDEGANADAAGKVVDYQNNLTGLAQAPKPKVDPAVAEQLLAQSQAVVDCINAIGT